MNNNTIWLFSYIVIIHILFIKYYATSFEYSYNGDLFIYKFNEIKYFFCLLVTVLMYRITMINLTNGGVANTTMVILNMLYFIPGVVQQAVNDEPWSYMIHYFLFWLAMEIWLKQIKRIDITFFRKYIKIYDSKKYFKWITYIAILLAVLLMFYNHKSFSISNLQETLLDVYGVRAEAKLAGTHWIILNIEYWAAFFIVISITYFAVERKWIMVSILFVAELSLFLIQANRSFFFLAGIALGIGIFKVNSKKAPIFMFIMALILFVEVNIIDVGLLLTDVFRRFSIVPNKLSALYYDYFLTHRPDYLGSMYERTFNLLGMHSFYIENPIGEIIGEVYFGREVNCNTGLVGGSMFCFGLPSVVISTFGYILGYRLFESIISKWNHPSVEFVLAFTMSQFSINAHAFLANLFNTSYYMLLFISLIPLSCIIYKSSHNESIIH